MVTVVIWVFLVFAAVAWIVAGVLFVVYDDDAPATILFFIGLTSLLLAGWLNTFLMLGPMYGVPASWIEYLK
jgi:hypothetical protein